MTSCARLLFVAAFVCSGFAFAAQADGRFSHDLSTTELQETGLAKMSSDEVAVLDALVRRDLAERLVGRTDEAPKLFSDRLSVDERRIAGLSALPASELDRVNALVERFQSIVVSRALLSPPVFVSRHANVKPREARADRKIHGTFSMSLGWGSDGYSERTGSMEVHTELAPGLQVGVGYSRTKVKGDGLYYYDPLYRPYPPIVVAPPNP